MVVWKDLGITNSYTLEASFCGSDFGKYSDLHFNTDMLQQIGHRFCESIIEYCMLDAALMKQILDELDNIENNLAQTVAPIVQPEQQPAKQPEMGQLGTIKDEDSNADSDFSGDDPNSPR